MLWNDYQDQIDRANNKIKQLTEDFENLKDQFVRDREIYNSIINGHRMRVERLEKLIKCMRDCLSNHLDQA